MTIAEQTKCIEAKMAAWCKTNGGTVKVANDLPTMFTILGAAPGAPRAAVRFVDQAPRDERYSDVTGRVDNRFWVCVSRGRGFNLDQGKSLTDGVAGGKAMFELAEEAREIIRAMRMADMDENDNKPMYKGIRPLEFEGVTTDTLYVEFTLAADIPQQA